MTIKELEERLIELEKANVLVCTHIEVFKEALIDLKCQVREGFQTLNDKLVRVLVFIITTLLTVVGFLVYTFII